MSHIYLRHANPGPAHKRSARLLSQAWDGSVEFGLCGAALEWDDSGWLDRPSSVEPPFADAPAWVLWRTYYWEQGLETDGHGRPMARATDRDLSQPEAEQRARSWALELGFTLPSRHRPAPILVVDIDHLFAYRGRGWWSHWGGLSLDLLRADFRAVRERWAGPDPFFSMSHWVKLQERFPHVELQFFALLAAQKGPYDRGVRPANARVVEALRQLALRFEVGAHLSYGSHNQPEGFRKELRMFDWILQRPTIRQRFHFLRNAGLPEVMEQLEDLGLREDWSNEFADAPGFRSGWANAFGASDTLKQVPVAIMDQNVIDQSPREIADCLHRLLEASWSVGAPLRIGTHWRIFGPRPDAERGAKDFTSWRIGLELWLMECKL